MGKARGSGGATAERLFHKWLISGGIPPEQIRRAIRTQWQSVDFFAADFMVIMDPYEWRHPWSWDSKDNFIWFVQVTTQNGRTARRRRIEAVAWPRNLQVENSALHVSLVTHERIPRPENRGKFDNFWVFERYLGPMGWAPKHPVAFDLEALEKVALRAPKPELRKGEKLC